MANYFEHLVNITESDMVSESDIAREFAIAMQKLLFDIAAEQKIEQSQIIIRQEVPLKKAGSQEHSSTGGSSGKADFIAFFKEDEYETPILLAEIKTPLSSEFPEIFTEKQNKHTIKNIAKKGFVELMLNEYELERFFGNNPNLSILTNGKYIIVFQGGFLKREFEHIVTVIENNKNLPVSVRNIVNYVETPNVSLTRAELYRTFENLFNLNDKDINRILNNIIKNADIYDLSNTKDVERLLQNTFTFKSIFNLIPLTNTKYAINKEFYKELLHILGLEERKTNNTIKIVPSGVENTFYSQIITRLEEKAPELSNEEKHETAMEILVIWLNRILFLKLFESILEKTQGITAKFMNTKKIPSTLALQDLFFSVLALPPEKRKLILQHLQYIPYLNSSLFVPSAVENKYVHISEIHGNLPIPLQNPQRKMFNDVFISKGKNVPLLEYLFTFLDSYNFKTMLVQEKRNDTIDSSVLGMIFEKINGYKDGSYYTPSEITMFMSRLAIEERILNEINSYLQQYNKEPFETIEEVIAAHKERIVLPGGKSIKDIVVPLLQNIKVIDPAVGTAHFLVSVLYVLLYYRYLFKIPAGNVAPGSFDSQDTKFEIRLTKTGIQFLLNKKPFIYNPEDKNSSLIQKYLYESSKEIIEHNLFGVDINPKAVEIAKLRLWITLLSFAYYTDYGKKELVTLPNIDFNIIVADSLKLHFISEHNLFSSAIHQDKKFQELLTLYKQYAETHDKQKASLIKQQIKEVEQELRKKVHETQGDNGEYWDLKFPSAFAEKEKGFDIVIGNPPYGIRIKPDKSIFPLEASKAFDSFKLFTIRGSHLVRPRGVFAFITGFSLTSNTAQIIIEKAFEQIHLVNDHSKVYTFERVSFIPFADYPRGVFEDADIATVIFIAVNKQKKTNKEARGTKFSAGLIRIARDPAAPTYKLTDIVSVLENNYRINVLKRIPAHSTHNGISTMSFANVSSIVENFYHTYQYFIIPHIGNEEEKAIIEHLYFSPHLIRLKDSKLISTSGIGVNQRRYQGFITKPKGANEHVTALQTKTLQTKEQAFEKQITLALYYNAGSKKAYYKGFTNTFYPAPSNSILTAIVINPDANKVSFLSAQEAAYLIAALINSRIFQFLNDTLTDIRHRTTTFMKILPFVNEEDLSRKEQLVKQIISQQQKLESLIKNDLIKMYKTHTQNTRQRRSAPLIYPPAAFDITSEITLLYGKLFELPPELIDYLLNYEKELIQKSLENHTTT